MSIEELKKALEDKAEQYRNYIDPDIYSQAEHNLICLEQLEWVLAIINGEDNDS